LSQEENIYHKIPFMAASLPPSTDSRISSLPPIFLFADSQLLFYKNQGVPFLGSIKNFLAQKPPRAAYLGASNGDKPEFYSIFESAMNNIGISDCRQIFSSFPDQDQSFLNTADIILLSGGSFKKGWDIFQSTHLAEYIIRRYREGALLIGISAGAIQLGSLGWNEESPPSRLINAFNFIPFILSAHEEMEQWRNIRKAVQLANGTAEGIGIPAGGGIIYHQNRTIEAIRKPFHKFSFEGTGKVGEKLIPPNNL
jgi:cyanophycinase